MNYFVPLLMVFMALAETDCYNISDDIYTRNGVLTIIKDISDHERMMMVGENELTEIEAELLERSRRSFYRSGASLGQETSKTLDYLLFESGYNRRVRPNNGGGPVEVNVNLAIRSMGPVDEMNEVYSLDCYFRQTWMDKRLSYNTSGLNELALNWAFLAKIWVPDTFFVNGKQSFLHKITVPNRFVRITPDGTVSYSQRLTLAAGCSMNLVKFPLDSQKCKLEIGSFGYTAKDVVYRWQKNPFSIGEEVALAQFHLANAGYGESIGVSGRRDRSGYRNDSSVYLDFLFERQTGFFLLQIYTPLTLIVFCSWVSFWLVKTEAGGEVPARTALGATTVLSIVNLGFGGKSKPKVGYATAMDMYIILCLAAVFAALVEFACINFIDTFIKRFKKWEDEQKQKEEKDKNLIANGDENNKNVIDLDTKDAIEVKPIPNGFTPNSDAAMSELVIVIENGNNPRVYQEDNSNNPFMSPLAKSECVSNVSMQDACVSTEDDDFEDLEEDEDEDSEDCEDSKGRSSSFQVLVDWLDTAFDAALRRIFRKYSPMIPNMVIYKDTLSVIYAIDDFSRKGFPFVFLCLQALYWTLYLYLL